MQQLIDNILAAMKSGRHADALTLSRTLIVSLPNDEGALSMLALCEQEAGDINIARELQQRLTRDHPATWQHWNNLGNVLRLLGDMKSAGEAYSRALDLNKSSVRLQANLGLLHLNLGDFVRAREHLCTAATMEGVEPGMLVWAAVACQACADDATATALIKDWRLWSRPSEEALLELGWLLFLLGDPEAADRILASEFQDSTLRRRALARRVLAHERINQLDVAVALTERMEEPARIADPKARMETLQALAIIATRQKDFEKARVHYTAALGIVLPSRYQQPLYFGLARACDQLGDAAAAMEALGHAHSGDHLERTLANQARLAGTGLLALADPKCQLENAPDWPAEDAPSAQESPVFVVGFPRSGTTLLEQMLGAHEVFVSADEQPMVQRMLESLREQGKNYPAGLSDLTASERNALRAVYWQEASRSVELAPGVRLVDKHPLNFLALPLIRRIFPNAPVIFCLRHPCDSILSSYMQNFRDPRLAAECTSIERLANLYVRLTERWIHDSTLFPERTIICRHEDLVADAGAQLRRIGEFLGIVDTSAMHQFSEHALARGFIGTPSYAQVVQGLNADAVGRWRRYERYLEPVLPKLAPIMDHWGYEI